MVRDPYSDPLFHDSPVGFLTPRPRRLPVGTRRQNPLTTPAFRRANAPDPRPLALPRPVPTRPAPPAAPGNAYGAPNVTGPAVAAARQVAGTMPALAGYPTGNDPSLLRQAQQLVGYELDPQIRAAQAAYNQENRDYGYLINQLNRQTGVARSDITTLFGALDQLLAANNASASKAYATASQKVAGQYDQLQSMLGDIYGKAAGAASGEQQRLGIAGPGLNDRLIQDRAYLTGLAAEQKANAVGNVQTLGANTAAAGDQLRSTMAAASPALVTQITMAANNQQQALLKQHIDNLSKFTSQVNLLNSQRAGKVAMTLKSLQDQLYQRQQDAAQMQFMNSIRAGQLGISAGQLQLAQARLAQEGQIATDRNVLEAKRLAAELARQNQAKPATQTGMERAYSYLAAAYPKRGTAQEHLQEVLMDAINGNSNDPGYNPTLVGQKGQIPGFDAKYLGEYLTAIDNAVMQRVPAGWGPIERNVLRNAVLKFFGR